MNHFLGNKGGGDADYKDGPTDDRKKQMENYRNMSDEDRTKYEIKWAEGHGGWGGHAPHGTQQSSSDFFRSHGYDRGGRGFDYSRTYSNMPRPGWMQGIYEELRESGVDQREEVHAINPTAYSGMARRSPGTSSRGVQPNALNMGGPYPGQARGGAGLRMRRSR